mmetsp:Transcript_17365/g.47907  ORF Transcript_17365/g.47907 Transcript_17365/m.47907 type:complete len:98 (-) Transcript_17365:2167-2460(-)
MQRNGFYAPFHKGLPMNKFLTLEWMSLDMNPANIPLVEAYLRANPPTIVNASNSPNAASGVLESAPSMSPISERAFTNTMNIIHTLMFGINISKPAT